MDEDYVPKMDHATYVGDFCLSDINNKTLDQRRNEYLLKIFDDDNHNWDKNNMIYTDHNGYNVIYGGAFFVIPPS